MKKIRHFRCDNCGIVERMVVDSVTVIKCECGCEAKRTISAPRYFGNSTGKSPAGRYKPC